MLTLKEIPSRLRRRGYYSVKPRYTPGSPAQVDDRIGAQVAREEEAAIEGELSGMYGPEKQARAQRLGLARVVEFFCEERNGFTIVDVLTREEYRREHRWREGQVVDLWDPEQGWRIRFARVTKTTPAQSWSQVKIKPLGGDGWQEPVEVEGQLLRLSDTVKRIEREDDR